MTAFRLPLALLAALGAPASAAPKEPPVLTAEIVRRYPHSPDAFTQGLVYQDGQLLESTGPYDRKGPTGKSDLRRVELKTGKVLQRAVLPGDFFAEGLAMAGNRLYQLTWTSGLGFIYDPKTFKGLGTFNIPTEGWGLAYDGRHLIRSDGSSTLYFLDPTTLREVRRVKVTAAGKEVARLNELEVVDGQILANVWLTDRIARIDPTSGQVTAWIDASALVREVKQTNPDNVLNGIAYDERGKRLFLTGKRWPALFEVRLRPAR